MPDLHAAILADILAHPDDKSPRLELADWLEETGQTLDAREGRSEWLRLNGWWQIVGADKPARLPFVPPFLRWRVLFGGVSFVVGTIDPACRPTCLICATLAEMHWPVRARGQLHKEWLCWACYEAGIIEGWIDSCVPRAP